MLGKRTVYADINHDRIQNTAAVAIDGGDERELMSAFVDPAAALSLALVKGNCKMQGPGVRHVRPPFPAHEAWQDKANPAKGIACKACSALWFLAWPCTGAREDREM